MTLTLSPRTAEQSIHPARRVTGAVLAVTGSACTVVAVMTGIGVLLGAVALVGAGFALSHRWTRLPSEPHPEPAQLVTAAHGSADYAADRPARRSA